ncbi:MAG: sulfotransferase family protein, partial [Acidimicrobiales bacterium]
MLPVPFIVGVGRSGTTLLRSILDAHSELAVVHESRFVAWMARHRGRYEGGSGFDEARFLADLLDEGSPCPSRLHSWDVAPGVVRAAVSAGRPADLAAAIRLVFRSYAGAQGKPRYGDKTPGYVRFLPAVGALLPEARFVHLVRDGRDVALSMLDVDFGGVNVAHAAWMWASRLQAAETAGRGLGPNRYLRVRYEDLVDAPEAEMGRICDFLTLEAEPAMLRHHERSDVVARDLGTQPHHDHARLPVTAGLRDWRAQMRPADVVSFETVAGPLLTELGYEVTSAAGGGGRALGRRVVT